MKDKVNITNLGEVVSVRGVPIEAEDFLQKVIKKANRKMPLQIRKDIDGISGATQTSKLILEGINETPEIINSLNAYRDILLKLEE